MQLNLYSLLRSTDTQSACANWPIKRGGELKNCCLEYPGYDTVKPCSDAWQQILSLLTTVSVHDQEPQWLMQHAFPTTIKHTCTTNYIA